MVSERAYLLHTEGRYHESLILFEGLLDIYPDHLYYRDAVSALYLSLHKPEEAIRHASIVIESQPAHVNAWIRRCEGYLMLGMTREAERDLERLRNLGPESQVRRMEMRLMAVKEKQLMQSSRSLER